MVDPDAELDRVPDSIRESDRDLLLEYNRRLPRQRSRVGAHRRLKNLNFDQANAHHTDEAAVNLCERLESGLYGISETLCGRCFSSGRSLFSSLCEATKLSD